MRCPRCASLEDKVIETRLAKEGDSLRRRRRCLGCDYRFTTYEMVVGAETLVVKRNGKREEFQPDKVRRGIERACEKRPVSRDRIDEMVRSIEGKVSAVGSCEVSSETIGGFVMEALRPVDQVAYVRFASVYRQFKDIDQFIDEIRRMTTEREEA